MNYKKERFKVAGVSHYVKDIMEKLSYENDDYSLSPRDLADIYDIGERIFEYSFDDCNASLVPEPTNEYDPNAIRIEVGGILIGYVKSGSCSHVKNLLNSSDFDHIKVEIGGGKYKRLYEDEDDKIKVERDSCGLFADLYIYTRQDTPKTETAPTAPPVAPSTAGSVHSGSDPLPASGFGPAPSIVQKNKKGGVVLIVFGVLFLIGGLGSFTTNILSGSIGLIIGCVCLYFGIKKRRNDK